MATYWITGGQGIRAQILLQETQNSPDGYVDNGLAFSRGFKQFTTTLQTQVTTLKILLTLAYGDDMETSKLKIYFGLEDHVSRMGLSIISVLL